MPGQWEGSTRTSRLPADWPQRRQAVIDRAGGVCERIKSSTDTRCTNPGRDCDHIIRPDDGGTDEPTNLELLCLWHHRQKTTIEGNDARRTAYAKTKRTPPKHPGLR